MLKTNRFSLKAISILSIIQVKLSGGETKSLSLNWLIENRTGWLLFAVFGLSVLSKAFIIPHLGAVWFPYSDEHLFIEMAKSLYYHHNLVSNVFLNFSQYNEWLFPLLLSPLYIFYSPDSIVTIFRVFGLLLMSAAVLPAYQLAVSLLGNKKQALFISIIAISIPEMSLAFSVSQEIVYYPLFLFILYLIYQKICGRRINTIFLGLMLYLLWVTKAVGVSIFVGYIVYLLFELVFIEKFKNYKSTILQVITILIVVFGLRQVITLFIRYANYGSFEVVNDPYTVGVFTRMASLQNNLPGFISDFLNGLLYYLFYSTLIFMVFPVVLPIDNFKTYSLVVRKFLLFISISFIVMISSIVVMVYMGEGGAVVQMQRVHFRYLFPFFVPFISLLLKLDFTKVKLNLFGVVYSSFISLYFLMFHPGFKNGSIIDAKSMLVIEQIDKRIVNGPTMIALLIALSVISLGYILYRSSNAGSLKRTFAWIILAILVANQSYAVYKTYLFYALETKGMTRQREYANLSKLLDSAPGTPLVINTPTFWINALYTTQSSKDFTSIALADNQFNYLYNPNYKPNFIIVPKNLTLMLRKPDAAFVKKERPEFPMRLIAGIDCNSLACKKRLPLV